MQHDDAQVVKLVNTHSVIFGDGRVMMIFEDESGKALCIEMSRKNIKSIRTQLMRAECFICESISRSAAAS